MKKQKYKWWKGRERWDLVLIGEPDAFAYIIRYYSGVWKSAAWCWILMTPRGHGETVTGWARAPHLAKRQVERAIEERWA